jgi:hypothetical protein
MWFVSVTLHLAGIIVNGAILANLGWLRGTRSTFGGSGPGLLIPDPPVGFVVVWRGGAEIRR